MTQLQSKFRFADINRKRFCIYRFYEHFYETIFQLFVFMTFEELMFFNYKTPTLKHGQNEFTQDNHFYSSNQCSLF